MSRPLLLLRPQPGNDRSAARARAMGMEVIQLPLFEIVPAPAAPPPAGPFDALLVTSINGARFAAPWFARWPDLPIFTVGAASAEAVRAQGGRDVRVGGGDAATTLPGIAAAGHRHILHLCGAETRPFDPLGLAITRHILYAAEPRDMRPFTKMLATLPASAIAVHSPAAGRRLNALLPATHRNHLLVAISQAAAQASGPGWRRVEVAASPDDTALLDAARRVCMSAI